MVPPRGLEEGREEGRDITDDQGFWRIGAIDGCRALSLRHLPFSSWSNTLEGYILPKQIHPITFRLDVLYIYSTCTYASDPSPDDEIFFSHDMNEW